uniref:Uncharacterized protein n=1 Tax=Trichogramma kaykai TaxID=54128 RepID=A0ABD2XJC3_9HYME
MFRALFKIYDRLDVDYIDDFGSTHFHAACQAGCDAVVQKYLELGRNPDLLVKTSGDSPLLLALERGHDKVAESLLRRGANPNLANEKRETPLHVICQRNKDDDEALEMLFELSNDRHRPVLLDVQDNLGNTPLHLAVYYDNEKVAKKLLQRGTNPNLTDVERLTPLHTICKSENMDNKKNVDLVKVIFEFHDKKNHPVSINAQDELGNTPLHLALDCRLELTAKFLLRTGADLRSINQENKTPLCILFKRDPHNLYALVKVLFEILHKADPPMPINAQNPWYEPPLLWSMSHLLPYLIDVHSTEYPDKWSLRKLKFKLASGVLAVVECLEKRQLYKLDRCDALTIMKFFVTHPLTSGTRRWANFQLPNRTRSINSNNQLTPRNCTFEKFLKFDADSIMAAASNNATATSPITSVAGQTVPTTTTTTMTPTLNVTAAAADTTTAATAASQAAAVAAANVTASKRSCWRQRTVHFTIFLAVFSTILTLLWVYTLTSELRRKAFDVNMMQVYNLNLSMDNPELVRYIRDMQMKMPSGHEPLNATEPSDEEQVIVAQLQGKRAGVYFEYISRIGAPSTTAWLERELGWRGVQILTDPRSFFDACRSSRNPKTRILRSCLSSDGQTKEVSAAHEDDSVIRARKDPE